MTLVEQLREQIFRMRGKRALLFQQAADRIVELERQSLFLESVREEALGVTEEQVARAARVIANSPLIDHPKLPAMNWRGFARQILEAALQSPARGAEGEPMVPQGETLWLIEQTSTVDGKRRFWNGAGFGWDALQAARYPSKQAAEEVARNGFNSDVQTIHGHPEVCGHMFQCGISPESPAKEQPGEVAAMVKRLRTVAEMREARVAHIIKIAAEAAALIEKLWQGWIPVREEDSKGGSFLTGIPGKPIYAVDERAEPYCWYRFDLPTLPPPPERP